MRYVWFFLVMFQPYRNWFLAGFMLSLFSTLAATLLLAYSAWFISAAAVAGMLAPDGVAITFNFMQPAAQIRLLAICRTLFRYGERIVTHEATFRGLAQLRSWLFAKMMRLSAGQLAERRSSELLTHMTQDIDALDALYLRIIMPVAIALSGTVLATIYLFQYSTQLAGILFTAIMFIGCLLPLLFMRQGHARAVQEQQLMAQIKIDQLQLLNGFSELTIFHAYQRFTDPLLHRINELHQLQKDNVRLQTLASALTQCLSWITVLIMLISTAQLLQQQLITGPQLAMLVFLIATVLEWINPLASSLAVIGKTKQAALRIHTISEQKPKIIYPAVTIQEPVEHDLVFDNISFRYQEHHDWLFKDFSLTVKSGETVAITGSSGVGKTTLLHFLLRFFDPQLGSVRLGDVDIRQLQEWQLYHKITFLPQQAPILSGTVRENLLLANETADDKQLYSLLELVGLADRIAELSHGLDTLVGEHGINISGGEARRLALARVFLKDAPCILLDEPLEFLDVKTSNCIVSALQDLTKNKTMLISTHKISAWDWVDRVITLT